MSKLENIFFIRRCQTFLIDAPILTLFGLIFSYFENPLRDRTIFSSRWFWHGLFFSSVFNAAAVYSALHFPDWMWMYFTNESQNSKTELIYIFAFLYYVPFVCGFYLGLDLRKIASVFWFVLILLCVLSEVWIVAHLFDRYSVLGTREQYYQSTAVSLFATDHALQPVMTGSLVVMGIYFLLVFFSYRRAKKHRGSQQSILI